MNKIVLQIGLLIFSVSIIYYSSRNIPLEDILLRSIIIFFAFTLLTGLIVLMFMKSINKVSFEKNKETNLH
ncbi:MAG: hypothetical protein Q8N83_02940 [Ignavibacteria bacterium]|nr:hypothetical protein [Ignavibacteria bacterium]